MRIDFTTPVNEKIRKIGEFDAETFEVEARTLPGDDLTVFVNGSYTHRSDAVGEEFDNFFVFNVPNDSKVFAIKIASTINGTVSFLLSKNKLT